MPDGISMTEWIGKLKKRTQDAEAGLERARRMRDRYGDMEDALAKARKSEKAILDEIIGVIEAQFLADPCDDCCAKGGHMKAWAERRRKEVETHEHSLEKEKATPAENVVAAARLDLQSHEAPHAGECQAGGMPCIYDALEEYDK